MILQISMSCPLITHMNSLLSHAFLVFKVFNYTIIGFVL